MRNDFHPARAYRAGAASPVMELENCLARIAKREPQVRAFVHIEPGLARGAAAASEERWREGRPLSDIDGLVVGLKDVIETADMPTGQGSPIWAGAKTGRDAACVEALRAAGAVILGKCTTTEFAFVEPLHHTRNPHDGARTPGGSSSGSGAAVAAGFVHVALGTQVLGSTLRPASYCGCVGYKTSLGVLNRGGIFDEQSQGCIGIFGMSVAQVWSVAETIASRVGGEPGHRTLPSGATAARPRQPNVLAVLTPGRWGRAEDRAVRELDRAVAIIRARGVEVRDSRSDPAIAALEDALCDVGDRSYALVDWEHRWPVSTYERLYPGGVSQRLSSRIARLRGEMTSQDYEALLTWRERLRTSYAETVRAYDAILALSATAEAPIGLGSTGDVAMNIPASTLGAPAISLPVLSSNGLPLGLQMIGRMGGDRELVEMAQWLELAFGAGSPVGAATAVGSQS